MKKLNRKIIGLCPVDSGQIMIADPCYLHDFTEEKYQATCEATLKGGGKVLLSSIAGYGVASSTFDGDGIYPVYAVYNEKGLCALTIELQ